MRIMAINLAVLFSACVQTVERPPDIALNKVSDQYPVIQTGLGECSPNIPSHNRKKHGLRCARPEQIEKMKIVLVKMGLLNDISSNDITVRQAMIEADNKFSIVKRYKYPNLASVNPTVFFAGQINGYGRIAAKRVSNCKSGVSNKIRDIDACFPSKKSKYVTYQSKTADCTNIDFQTNNSNCYNERLRSTNILGEMSLDCAAKRDIEFQKCDSEFNYHLNSFERKL